MNEQDMPQKYMAEIHRFIQKLKEGGMAVDSSVDTQISVIDGTVKYTDSLTITGDITSVRFDPRPLDQVQAEAEKQKAAIQAQNDEVIAKVDEVITVVKAETGKTKKP